jgi:hypothetical protein
MKGNIQPQSAPAFLLTSLPFTYKTETNFSLSAKEQP